MNTFLNILPVLVFGLVWSFFGFIVGRVFSSTKHPMRVIWPLAALIGGAWGFTIFSVGGSLAAAISIGVWFTFSFAWPTILAKFLRRSGRCPCC
jgi:hypothetical protein